MYNRYKNTIDITNAMDRINMTDITELLATAREDTTFKTKAG